MPASHPRRLRAAGVLLLALGLELAACGAAVPNPSVTGDPGPSDLVSASASLAAMSVAPSFASTAEPSMTIGPSATASPATPTASVATPTGAPSATATPSPTRRPTPAPTKAARPTPKATLKATLRPTPKPTPAPVVLRIEARDFLFSPSSLAGPAGVPFALAFTNADAAIPHNITIATGAGAAGFNGKIINGVASINYQVPAFRAGTYRLGCVVHPAMTGTLTID